MIDVRVMGPEADRQYADFLDRSGDVSPSVLAYHYPLYREIIRAAGGGEPLYLGAFDEDGMIGALPGFVKDNTIGSCYCSLPFFGPNAGVISPERDSERLGDIHSRLIAAALTLMGQRPRPLTASFYTPFLAEHQDLYRSALGDAVEVDKQTQYLDLQALQAFDSKISYDIRKAQKAGVTISTEASKENVDAFYRIYEENCREFGIPLKPFGAIESLVREGCANGSSRLYLAFHESSMVGGLLVLWSRKTVSYYVPCTKTSARDLQSSTLLIDRAIRDAQHAGREYWNWESSPPDRSGVFDFKKKWGSLRSAYTIFVKRFCAESDLQAIGSRALGESFPYFFVYPYGRLAS